MNILRWVLIGALSFQCVSASAQDTSTISLVVGFKAGGTSTTSARLVAQAIEETTRHHVLVENRSGATGLIAAEWVKRQKPDGRTLLFVSSSSALSVPPTDELVAVAVVAMYDYFVVIKKDTAATLPEYFEAARHQDALRSVATPGAGSMAHLLGEKLFRSKGIQFENVPYLGAVDAVRDVLGGHVPAAIVPYPDYIGHKDDDGLRSMLATIDGKIIAEGWMGVYAPAKTPPEEVRRLSEIFRVAVERSKDKLDKVGFRAVWKKGSELRRLHDKDYANFLPEITRLGIKP